MITPRTQRSVFRMAALLTVGGASALGWLAYQALASETASPPISPIAPKATSEGQSIGPRHAVDPKSDAWRRRLRQPLYDPPPPAIKIVKKELPPIRSKLLGTILEPGASRAMIRVPSGTVEFRSEGDPLGPHDPDAVIDSIDAQSITVSRGEETTQLTIDPRN